jgi:hypothetical protein
LGFGVFILRDSVWVGIKGIQFVAVGFGVIEGAGDKVGAVVAVGALVAVSMVLVGANGGVEDGWGVEEAGGVEDARRLEIRGTIAAASGLLSSQDWISVWSIFSMGGTIFVSDEIIFCPEVNSTTPAVFV